MISKIGSKDWSENPRKIMLAVVSNSREGRVIGGKCHGSIKVICQNATCSCRILHYIFFFHSTSWKQ